MYLYETHVHTSPLSACGRATSKETLDYYKSAGYAGVFMTNHFIDGNCRYDLHDLPYEERIRAFFADQDEAVEYGKTIGLDVFSAFEMSYKGTDFLIYGIDAEWCIAHENMHEIKKSTLLTMLKEDGALIIQAHPYREDPWIDHIRLYPRHVHGVEIFNACRWDFDNEFSALYCKYYGLIPFAGSDNHIGEKRPVFGGMATETPIIDATDFKNKVLSGEAKPFRKDENGVTILV